MVVAFFLPKGAFETQRSVGFEASETLQRPKPTMQSDTPGCQQVHMVGHDNERVQLVSMESILAGSQSFYN